MFLVQPGTEEEERTPEQVAAVRGFFADHPEYQDEDKRNRLADHACGLGLEGAHAYLTSPPPKTAVRATVEGDAWRVVVMHTKVHCTSDDFGWYMAEAQEAAVAAGAQAVWAGPKHDAIELSVGGGKTERVSLGEHDFLILRAGQDMVPVEYGPGMAGIVSEVLAEDAP